jgi:hypothetical protein
MVSPGRTTLSELGRRAGTASRQTGRQSFLEVVNLTHGISAASWVPASLFNRIGCESSTDVEVAAGGARRSWPPTLPHGPSYSPRRLGQPEP